MMYSCGLIHKRKVSFRLYNGSIYEVDMAYSQHDKFVFGQDTVEPICCRTGEKITLVGSRFTHSAESLYEQV